jgi:Helix-turn-helix of DDE superfamily endonuclease
VSKYEEVKDLPDKAFRRAVGICKKLFYIALEILKEAFIRKKKRGGKKNKLSVENMLLMCLEYLREYRTYFHLGLSYNISESACYRNCRWVEDTLIKSGRFNIPGKKALLEERANFDIILLDATESPIERPKKKAKEQKKQTNIFLFG